MNLKKAKLTDNEKFVFEHRMGMVDGFTKTHQQIANSLGFSRQWVVELEKRALVKLKASNLLQDIDNY